MSEWTHDCLQADLADSRARSGDIVVEGLTLGPGYMGSPIADLVAIRPSWTRPCPTVWECKVTRSDFLSDVRSKKYEKYLPFCERFYYAVPRGLVHKDEVPDGVGLQYRNAKGWYTVRAPRLRLPLHKVHDLSLLAFAVLLRQHGVPWRSNKLARLRSARHEVRTWRLGNIERIRLSEAVTEMLNEARSVLESHRRTA